MMVRFALVVLAAILLGACAALPPRAPMESRLIKPPASADEAIGIAHDLVKRGHWSDALLLLDSASRSFPDNRNLVAEREALGAQWEREQQILEDRIMVGDAESQQRKIGLLEQLSLGDRNDLVVASRRIYWKEVLRGKVEQLTSCGERHAVSQPTLARRCFEIASLIPGTEKVEARLARIEEQLRASEDIAAERRRQREEKERQARAKVLLDNAKRKIEARDYRDALDTLDKVAELQPNNSEVPGLQQAAWSMISPQVEALVKLGDHLYLDEQLDAAVATWQAALGLKPDDEDILARIERAKTVLNRLDLLRQQQRSPITAE